MKKRILALLLAAVLVMALVPAASAADSDFFIENGVLTAYIGSGGNVTIPDGVTAIGAGAFYLCEGLTSVTIPASVTSIGEGAFEYCENLTSVTIPASVTSIGEGAFRGCEGLADGQGFVILKGILFDYFGDAAQLDIPDGVTNISEGAFGGHYSLIGVTIPGSVTSIGSRAFSLCENLVSVTIPNSVTSIGEGAFSNCNSLTGVTIPNSVTSISNDTFSYCISLTSVAIPGSVTAIGDYAFSDCYGLTSVTIPASVTSIGQRAFSFCDSLTSVTLPASGTSLGEGAFEGCKGLADGQGFVILKGVLFDYFGDAAQITIPNGVTTISDCAFAGCYGLTSVTIPDSVTAIGNEAFESCAGLTSVTIPASVTAINYWAFYDCGGLTDVYYNGSQDQWGKIICTHLEWDGAREENIEVETSFANGGQEYACLEKATIHYNSGPAFTDVKPGEWYAKAVTWAVARNITNGTGGGKFSPKQQCTQAEIITFLWRAAGEPKPAATVTGTEFYAKAVQWAKEKKIIDGSFELFKLCTRETAVTYMWKYAGSPTDAPAASFPDVPAGSDFAKAVAWALQQEVTEGTDQGLFLPETVCDRGQIVTFLYRAFA